jgi:hypothetical protein
MIRTADRVRSRRASPLSPIAEPTERSVLRGAEEGGARTLSLNGLSPIARATLPAAASRAPAIVPVILRATAAEAKGARMRIGGVRIADRAIRQLARFRDARVVIATDGSFPLPRNLPPNMERRQLGEDVETDLAALEAELGPETISVGADAVWLQPRRPDRVVRVVDAASHKLAAAAVFGETDRDALGVVDRLLNYRIVRAAVRHLFASLPVTPGLLVLGGGVLGLWGALLVGLSGWQNVVLGFAALQGYVLLSASAAELGRVRLAKSRGLAWMGTVVADVVSLATALAVGLSLWKRGGAYLDMMIALVTAAFTVLQAALVYRELRRQREADVTRVRWWFAYGQSLRGMSGAGSTTIRTITALGRRDFVIFAGLVLACLDQVAILLPLLLVVAFVRTLGAFGQLFMPEWRIRARG